MLYESRFPPSHIRFDSHNSIGRKYEVPNKENFKLNSDWYHAVQLFLQDWKVRNFSGESIRRYRKGLEKLQQHLESLELQLRYLSPDIFVKQVIPSLLDEGLAFRTLNCILHIYKTFERRRQNKLEKVVNSS